MSPSRGLAPAPFFRLLQVRQAASGTAGTFEGRGCTDTQLWEQTFITGQYTVRLYAAGLDEGWYDPVTQDYIVHGDTTCWQYNFRIPELTAFIQQGTQANPKVYWLGLDVLVPQATPQAEFGWKTTASHWNDDAVWQVDGNPSWSEIRYPVGHPLAGQSIDQAFVITPEPGASALLLSALGTLALRRRR